MSVVALTLAACGSSSKSSSTLSSNAATATTAAASAETIVAGAVAQAATATTAAPAAEAPTATDAAVLAAPSGAEDQAAPPAGGGTLGGNAAFPVGRKIIVTGTVTIETDDIGATAKSIGSIVARVGGGVASSQIQLGEQGHATITVKLPPETVQPILDELATIGTITHSTQQGQDVTSQITDLNARILSAVASVDRAREFLKQATTVSDLANLESELTNRETLLEQLRAQAQNLGEQVSAATLTIELVPAPPVVAPVTPVPPPLRPPSGWMKLNQTTVGSAFRSGGHAFATAAKFVAVILAGGSPFIALAAVLGMPLWLMRRRRQARRLAARRSMPIEPIVYPSATTQPAPSTPSTPTAEQEHESVSVG